MSHFLFSLFIRCLHIAARLSSERNARSILQKVIALVSGLGRLGSNHNDARRKSDLLGPANASKDRISNLKTQGIADVVQWLQP